MNDIDTNTERKIYQALGVLRILANITPQGSAEQLRTLLENVTDAAEGAAAILEDVAYKISENNE